MLALLIGAACAQDVPVAPKKPVAAKQEEPKAKATSSPRLPPDPNKFAVVISGIGGDEAYSTRFAKWAGDLRSALVERLGFAEERVTTLTEKPSEEEQPCSADVVRDVFGKLRDSVKPDNQVFIFFIGHGSFDGKVARFNLMGRDLSSADYAQLIKGLPSRKVVIVNMASASGEFIKPLSGAGRVVITATRSGQEQNATRFAEHFIAALGKSSPTTTTLVDEAYFEYATMPGYETMIPLAIENPRVVVARTFSKAFGMAGLRIGYAVGHRDSIAKLRNWDADGAVNVLGLSAARAALTQDPNILKNESKRNTDARAFTVKWFKDHGYTPTDSQTNFLFVDIKRPARGFREACAKQGILVGRDFPPYEKTHCRISISTMEDMQKAVKVFEAALAVPAQAA